MFTTAADHVSGFLAFCSSLLYTRYALRVLRSHGLPDQLLKDTCVPCHRYWEVDVLCANVAPILLGF